MEGGKKKDTMHSVLSIFRVFVMKKVSSSLATISFLWLGSCSPPFITGLLTLLYLRAHSPKRTISGIRIDVNDVQGYLLKQMWADERFGILAQIRFRIAFLHGWHYEGMMSGPG